MLLTIAVKKYLPYNWCCVGAKSVMVSQITIQRSTPISVHSTTTTKLLPTELALIFLSLSVPG